MLPLWLQNWLRNAKERKQRSWICPLFVDATFGSFPPSPLYTMLPCTSSCLLPWHVFESLSGAYAFKTVAPTYSSTSRVYVHIPATVLMWNYQTSTSFAHRRGEKPHLVLICIFPIFKWECLFIRVLVIFISSGIFYTYLLPAFFCFSWLFRISSTHLHCVPFKVWKTFSPQPAACFLASLTVAFAM